MKYVLSLDLGTSSVRASLYDQHGLSVPGLTASLTHAPTTTPDGGAEMDADALLERAFLCIESVLAQAGDRTAHIAGVGICTFWHSILGVGADGRAATPILMWGDTRSVAQVEELRHTLNERALHARTGCLFHTSYVPPRLLWTAQHRPEWLRAATRWMSPGEYLHLRLFGQRACSISMASGTGMYAHASGLWDDEMLGALPIAQEQLSPIVDTLTPFQGLLPEFAWRLPALASVPWFPAAGDGACSNVGSGCIAPDRLGLMVGTSGALRIMRGQRRAGNDALVEEPAAPWGLWKYRYDKDRYLLGGALSNGGSLFAWLRDTLRLPEGLALEQALAQTEPDGHGLTILPFLAGERCPGWRGDARAAIVGLSQSTRSVEIARAGLEAVAHRFALIHDLLDDVAAHPHRIIASGGALLASPTWTQLLADALGAEVVASDEQEASARGAALIALEGTGLIRTLEEVPARTGRTFSPDSERHALYRSAGQRQRRLYHALIASDWQAADTRPAPHVATGTGR